MLEQVWIPIAVRYDIPMNEFWKMNPRIMERNLPYYIEQQKRKAQNRYEMAWMFGNYVRMAIGNALGGNKNPYPEAPVDLYAEDVPEEVKSAKVAETWFAMIKKDNKEHYGIASLDPQELKDAEKII